jgi:His-Xaa-Ser system protein HxsD
MSREPHSTPGQQTAGPRCSLRVDLRVYALSAVKKALYAVGGAVSGNIELVSEAEAVVSFYPATDGASVSSEELQARFSRELLDYDLRASIAAETEPLRNLIVAHALSRVPLLHPELESGMPDAAVTDEQKRRE